MNIASLTKKIVALAVAVVGLAACISVDDFGSMWANMTTDSDIAGQWTDTTVGASKQGTATVTIKDGSYDIISMHDGKPDAPNNPVRTLTAGPYKFFAEKNPTTKGGNIARYEIQDGKLVIYGPTDAVWEYVSKNYPKQKNMTMSEGLMQIMSIKVLDDEVVKILSEIPPGDVYWRADMTFTKNK